MMISYAQNFEDVILERIFKDRESGFYVDIGACHPVYDSVTHHFYLKGWCGINVEPQPNLFSELKAVRERDTNLQLCVGSQPGNQTLYITHDVGTSTLNKSIAENYRTRNNIDQELTVELITLDQIWSKYVGKRQVDFMKIDVEGFEKEVLIGADFSKVTPSVLIIEATIPNSQELCYDQWEDLILEHYEFFYFDGLNRFYSRKGFPLSRDVYLTPPNVFDQFKVYPQIMLEQANKSLTIENEDLKKQLQTSLAQLARKDEALDNAGNAYADLRSEDQNLHEQLELARESASGFQTEIAKARQAYETLQAAYDRKEQDLLGALEYLRTKEDALADASKAYESLRERHLELQASVERSFQEVSTLTDFVQDKERACAEAASSYESLWKQLQTKEGELRDLQGHLSEKDDALQHAMSAYQALQDELKLQQDVLRAAQSLLQEKDFALQDATHAYETLQEEFGRSQFEISNIGELLRVTKESYQDATDAYISLRTEFEKKLGELTTLDGILQEKESAIQDAGTAYEVLKVAFEDAQTGAVHASELFQSSARNLEDAQKAYQALKEQFEEKLAELAQTQNLLIQRETMMQESAVTCTELHHTLTNTQVQLQEAYDHQKESDLALSEATSYCESLVAQVQQKDDALSDAARAYQALKEEFDAKIRELGELYASISNQSKPQDQ